MKIVTGIRDEMISIVIPNFNTGKYLGYCLDSIFNQSYKDFEIIVIDAYSKDHSHKILKHYNSIYGNQLTIAMRRAQGQSNAINAGIELAHGNIIAYICADDTYEKDCFRIVSEYFDKHPHANWIYGKGKIIGSNHRETRSFITKSKEFLQPFNNCNILKCVDYIVQPTVFMRKEFFNKVGIFNTELRFVMDYEYWLRASRISKPMFINSHLANWRAHSGSLSVREHEAEAKQALIVQKQYSGKLFRPIQKLVYFVTITLYGNWMQK